MPSFNQYLLARISQPSTQPVSLIPDITITSYGIAQLLSGLDVKALGPDNIGHLMLKELYDIITPIFRTIFNASLKNHVVPKIGNLQMSHLHLKREIVINYASTDQSLLLVLNIYLIQVKYFRDISLKYLSI